MGHIARSVILANYLVENYNVSLIIDKNKKKRFQIKNKISLIYKSLTKNISVKKKYILDKKLLLNFKNYDLILSDNLIEPIFNNNRVILISNFFWHDVFTDLKLKKKFLKILKRTKIKLLRNYLFSYNKYMKSLPIPFLGKFNNKYKKSKKNILISLGTAQIEGKHIIFNTILTAIEKFVLPKVYLDKDIYDFLKKKIKNNKLRKKILVAKYDQKMFDEVSIAIIKPGLGIVRDCLSNSIKMVIPKKNYNKEFSYNSKILKIKKLGILTRNFEESLMYSKEYNKNDNEKQKYFNICKKLKWDGEKIVDKEIKKFLKY